MRLSVMASTSTATPAGPVPLVDDALVIVAAAGAHGLHDGAFDIVVGMFAALALAMTVARRELYRDRLRRLP